MGQEENIFDRVVEQVMILYMVSQIVDVYNSTRTNPHEPSKAKGLGISLWGSPILYRAHRNETTQITECGERTHFSGD